MAAAQAGLGRAIPTESDAEQTKLQRRLVHQALEQVLQLEERARVLSGWVVVYETADEDGGRTLSCMSGDAFGETDLTPWAAEGLLRYVGSRGDEFLVVMEEADDDDAEA